MMVERMKAADALPLLAQAASEQPEAAIKKAVRDYLAAFGWFIIPIQQGAKGIPVRIMRGISDLIVCRRGVVVFLEVKTDAGRLSENQKRFRDDLAAHGCTYRVTRGIDDLGDMR